MSQLAHAFGSIVNLTCLLDGYDTSIRNIDKDFMLYMIYNYATQQAENILRIFRFYLISSKAMGNVILTLDPYNPINAVLKSTVEIVQTLVSVTSCNALLTKAYFNTTSGCRYRICKQSLDGSEF